MDSDANTVTGQSSVISVISGQVDNSVDAGLFQLANIGNFAWEDQNNNGIQDLGEPGISGITIQLFTSGGSLVGSDTTDGSGFYEFNNVTPRRTLPHVLYSKWVCLHNSKCGIRRCSRQ